MDLEVERKHHNTNQQATTHKLLWTSMFFSCTHVISHDSSIATTTHHLFKDKIQFHFHIKFIIDYRKLSIHIFLCFIGFLLPTNKPPPKSQPLPTKIIFTIKPNLKIHLKGFFKNLLMLHVNLEQRPLCNHILHKYTQNHLILTLCCHVNKKT